MTTRQTYIYDLHGVITDTSEILKQGWVWVAEQLDYKLSDKQYQKIAQLDKKEALERILKWSLSRISEAEKQHLLNERDKMYKLGLDDLSPKNILAGFSSFNTTLRAKGYKCAVISTSQYAIKIIDRLGLVLDVDAIVDRRMIEGNDIHVELLQTVGEKLDCAPDQCILISRNPANLAAAELLNMQTINFGDNNQSNAKLIAHWERAQVQLG